MASKTLIHLQKVLGISDEIVRQNKKLFNDLLNGYEKLAEPTAELVNNFINYIKTNYKYVYCNVIGFDGYENNSIKLICTNLSQAVAVNAYVTFSGALEEGCDGISVNVVRASIVESAGGTLVQSTALLYSKDASDLTALVEQLDADNIEYETNIEIS